MQIVHRGDPGLSDTNKADLVSFYQMLGVSGCEKFVGGLGPFVSSVQLAEECAAHLLVPFNI